MAASLFREASYCSAFDIIVQRHYKSLLLQAKCEACLVIS